MRYGIKEIQKHHIILFWILNLLLFGLSPQCLFFILTFLSLPFSTLLIPSLCYSFLPLPSVIFFFPFTSPIICLSNQKQNLNTHFINNINTHFIINNSFFAVLLVLFPGISTLSSHQCPVGNFCYNGTVTPILCPASTYR